jgi:hypothetical protein
MSLVATLPISSLHIQYISRFQGSDPEVGSQRAVQLTDSISTSYIHSPTRNPFRHPSPSPYHSITNLTNPHLPIESKDAGDKACAQFKSGGPDSSARPKAQASASSGAAAAGKSSSAFAAPTKMPATGLIGLAGVAAMMAL